MSISQSDFEVLLREKKEFSDLVNPVTLGPAPIKWTREIKAIEARNTYLLDFYRGNFEMKRYTFNKRYRKSIILLRYDNGGRHTNPDGKSFDGPHIHLYKENYDDNFAYPISELKIEYNDPIDEVLRKILQFCNVIHKPIINVPLF